MAKEQSKQVRGEALEKLKAGFGCKAKLLLYKQL